MNWSTKRAILGFLGVFALVLSVGFGVLVVQNQQAFSEKAAPTTEEKLAEIAKSIGQTSNPNIATFSSKDFGYQINFDKNYWANEDGSFSLNNLAGSAKVNVDAKPLTQKIKPTGSAASNLDLLTAVFINETRPTATERVHINGHDFEKLTYQTSFLNQKGEYYKFIAVNGSSYYVITTKYSTFGSGKDLTNQFLNSFSFFTPSVKGASTDGSNVTALTESKIVELTKPSVFEIAHLFCDDVTIPNLTGTKFLKGNYTFCGGGLGSGFAINAEGVIATNGHVVQNYPEELLVESIVLGSESIKPFALDLLQEFALVKTGQEISTDQANILLSQVRTDPTAQQIFLSLIYQLLQNQAMTLKVNKDRYVVKLANDPFVIDTGKTGTDILNAIPVSDTIKEASFVASNYPNQYTVDAILNSKTPKGSDVALIKISDPGSLVFPSLKLGTSDSLKEGGDVLVIGYPGLVSGQGDSSSLVSQKSSATPTVTRGIISAIKNDNSGLKLIQVDASIDHGNSGGPAFDQQGEVIGIATYGIGSQSGNYNFLRDIDDLKKLASDNSITFAPSDTYSKWAQGLSFFWVSHYKQAEIPFGQVQKDYPIHPSVENYVADSNTAIQKGQDRSDLLFLLLNDRKTQIWVISSILGIVAIGIMIILFIKRRKTPQIPMQTNTPSFTPLMPHPNGPMANPV